MTKVIQTGGNDERRPHRFDPDQRGRDFPNKRKRRGHGQQTQTPERRITDLETWSYQSTRIAIQPPANSRIQVVTDLPEATYLDIGRQLIVRSPAAVKDVLYVGMQQGDGTVAWVQWTSSYEGGGGVPIGGVAVSVTFVKHISLGVAPWACHATASYVYFTYEGGANVRRIDRTTGTITTLGFPGTNTTTYPLRGLYAQDDGKVWIGFLSNLTGDIEGGVYYWNGSSLATKTGMDTDVYGIAYHPILDSIFVVGYSYLAGSPSSTGGRARQLNKSTLAIVDSAIDTSQGRSWQGVAIDSAGFVYISRVDTDGSYILKFNSTLDYLTQFDGAGSLYGALGAGRRSAFDGSDRLFVADSSNNRIQVFDTDGLGIGAFGVGGTGVGQFNSPYDVTIHGSSLWVADRLNNRLSEWTIN